MPPGAGFRPPRNACDAHAHIFGPFAQYPLAGVRPNPPQESPLEAFLATLDEFGFDRGVITQSSFYGLDNTALVDALGRAKGRLRGIVVLEPETLTDSELARLDKAGVRGVRIIAGRSPVGPKLDKLEAIGDRLCGTKWHIEVVPPHAIEPVVELRPRLEKLGVPVSFDMMGFPDVNRSIDDPHFQALLTMVHEGLVWVKLSHPYDLADYPYTKVLHYAQALVAANRRRCVYGGAWPHSHQVHPPAPSDAFLVDLFAEWVPDAATRKTILVDNPAELYGF